MPLSGQGVGISAAVVSAVGVPIDAAAAAKLCKDNFAIHATKATE